jgi:hypothetical protein
MIGAGIWKQNDAVDRNMRGQRVAKQQNIGISKGFQSTDEVQAQVNTAGISLYRDCLYRNLYVMPI